MHIWVVFKVGMHITLAKQVQIVYNVMRLVDYSGHV